MTADKLNAILERGGEVQITTYLRSTTYTRKHAGWFTSDAAGNVYVKRSRTRDCLTMGGGSRWLVGLKTT